jgi:hypothetical protein
VRDASSCTGMGNPISPRVAAVGELILTVSFLSAPPLPAYKLFIFSILREGTRFKIVILKELRLNSSKQRSCLLLLCRTAKASGFSAYLKNSRLQITTCPAHVVAASGV